MDYIVEDVEGFMLSYIEEIEKVCFSCPWTQEQLRGQLKDDSHEFIAAVDGDRRVLGYVGMTYVLDEGYISNVAVSPQARRQGIGDRLVAALLEKGAGLGLAFITLEVRESNAQAFALYEKHGFVSVGRRKAYYSKPREDAILMTYFLNRGIESENTCI